MHRTPPHTHTLRVPADHGWVGCSGGPTYSPGSGLSSWISPPALQDELSSMALASSLLAVFWVFCVHSPGSFFPYLPVQTQLLCCPGGGALLRSAAADGVQGKLFRLPQALMGDISPLTHAATCQMNNGDSFRKLTASPGSHLREPGQSFTVPQAGAAAGKREGSAPLPTTGGERWERWGTSFPRPRHATTRQMTGRGQLAHSHSPRAASPEPPPTGSALTVLPR